MIRVLIVDDSAIIRTMVRQILTDDRIEIVGEVSNGALAIEANRNLSPDVIIMDINMPIMNGIDAIRVIMKEQPTAILVFSTEDSASVAYNALEAGAIDIIPKPALTSFTHEFYYLFTEKVVSLYKKNKVENFKFTKSIHKARNSFEALVIGASTGGPIAVKKVLGGIGPSFPLPIFIAQHIDSSFDKHFASWLAEASGMHVELAEDGKLAESGNVYVAPADYHLVLRNSLSSKILMTLTSTPPVHFLRPAVDPLFISASALLGSKCLAVLLTGMGRDGAEGCRRIVEAGGYTIAESPETCIVFGMPKAAIEIGGASDIIALDKIPQELRRLTSV